MHEIFDHIRDNNLEIVKQIINSGIDVNIKSHTGSSILMHMVYKGEIDIVKYLIQNGADINNQNRDGHTALI
jgi:ankyrin repeat protein